MARKILHNEVIQMFKFCTILFLLLIFKTFALSGHPDLVSKRAELLERQLQDKTHELKQCIEENVDLKRIIEQQSNSIDSLTYQNYELNFLLSSVIYVTSFFIFMEKRVTPPLMCFYIYVLCS